MIRDLVFGIGGLLLVVPALLIGVSYADGLGLPSLTDMRFRLVFIGLALMLGARLRFAVVDDEDADVD